MQSKIIFVILFMLSFNILHDSVMPLIEQDCTHYVDNTLSDGNSVEFNEIHNMFHFMAIVAPLKNSHVQLAKRENIPHLIIQYTPPLEKTSYKPPIA